jgi:putative transposase
MTDKFQNKYRIPPARLQSWNYGLQASYFVTVCTAERVHFFGEVINGEMILSDIGKIVEEQWTATPEIRPDMNLELDAFCVMPNHFHGIIIIGDNQFNRGTNAMHRTNAMRCRDAMHRVSTPKTDRVSAPKTDRVLTAPLAGNKFGAQSKNLASIMRGFKSAVTVAAKSVDKNFKWQTRFHDHIIRNDAEFQRIREYIIENPRNWEKDMFYVDLPQIK